MSQIKPRVSEHPVGPFALKESNAALMRIIGQLSADLREMSVTPATRDEIEQLIRRTRDEIKQLPTGSPETKDQDIDEAMKLMTRILDRTLLHHLMPKEQELFCRSLLKIADEHSDQAHFFNAVVFNHIKALSHAKESSKAKKAR